MTAPPNEPAKPAKPAELYEPTGGDPFSAFAAPAEQPPAPGTGTGRPIGLYDVPEPIIPVAPHRESGAGVKIVVVLAVFALLLGGVIFWVSTKDTIHFGGGSASTPIKATTTSTQTTTPTTTAEPAPFAEVGDCVLMTGQSLQPDFKKVACGEHNYTVSKVASSSTEKCGADDDTYVKYNRFGVLEKSVSLCLIPVFTDGQCYDFALGRLAAAVPRKECGSFGAVRAKVLADTVDKAACGADPLLALAYPEIKTTYCFTPSA
jgi:hypothetical protein